MSTTTTPDSRGTFVALLRGINVGGKNIVSMSALKESFARLGFTDIATYINSGNVLFKSTIADPRKLETKIEKMLASEHVPCKVVIRSADEIAQLIKRLPKDWTGDKDWRYNVIFLRHGIDSKDVVSAFTPKPDIEKLTYVPGTLLWCAHAKDVTRTAMLKLSSHRLFPEMTVRNLNTTKKLHELLQKM
jgi:uncharacterized protein (DUF1697 family)